MKTSNENIETCRSRQCEYLKKSDMVGWYCSSGDNPGGWLNSEDCPIDNHTVKTEIKEN